MNKIEICCTRCYGKGVVSGAGHVCKGVCFKCNGAGKVVANDIKDEAGIEQTWTRTVTFDCAKLYIQDVKFGADNSERYDFLCARLQSLGSKECARFISAVAAARALVSNEGDPFLVKPMIVLTGLLRGLPIASYDQIPATPRNVGSKIVLDPSGRCDRVLTEGQDETMTKTETLAAARILIERMNDGGNFEELTPEAQRLSLEIDAVAPEETSRFNFVFNLTQYSRVTCPVGW